MSDQEAALADVQFEFGEALATAIRWRKPGPALIVVADDAAHAAAILPTLRATTAQTDWEWRVATATDLDVPGTTGIRELVEAWCLAAQERDSGLVLAVPDAHLLELDTLSALGSALQLAIADRWPLVAVLTGDETLYGRILDGPSYLERANWNRLDN